MSRVPDDVTRGMLLAVAGLVVGCGSGGSAPALHRTGAISKAEAIAYAQAVNLDVADLPRLTSVSLEHDPKPSRTEVIQARCTHAVDPRRRIVAVEAPTPQQGSVARGYEEFTSVVEVLPTAALAARN